MSEQEIEQEIQDKGLNAPRLSPADIDAVIVGETFTVMPSGKATVCELTLANGFTVRGESACVSKANFNEEIGRKISRENARNKVWGLEGYQLQCKLAQESRDNHNCIYTYLCRTCWVDFHTNHGMLLAKCPKCGRDCCRVQ